jgi:hypothetical protein
MTILDIHADALNSENAIYHEFLLHYKANANTVYGIVEGKEDPMFYRGLIEQHLPQGWEIELIPAGCKDKVLRAFGIFDWTRFPQNRICFFVDRDLDDFFFNNPVSVENIYVTDKYSIENEAVCSGVLKRLLSEILNINDLNPDEFSIINQKFVAALGFFQESMVPVMAQILLWRREGKRPCLNEIKPKEFFAFVNGNILLKAEFEEVSARLLYAANCVHLQPSNSTDLSNVEAEFRQNRGTEKFIRGKYMLWFLVEFALHIHCFVSVLIARYSSSPKVRLSLGPGNAMVILAPRTRCPASLREFLGCTYVHYIQNISQADPQIERAT